MTRVFLGFLALLLLAEGGRPQSPPVPAQDRLLLKVARDLPQPEAPGAELSTTGDEGLDRALNAAGVCQMKRVFRHPPRGWREPAAAAAVGLDRWLVVGFGTERGDLPALLRRLAALPTVEAAEPEQVAALDDTTPDDPDFGNQYALQDGKLRAPLAWDIASGSTHVLAVIDSGAQLNHPDLGANLWINEGEIPNNGVDDDGNGYVDDRRGYDFFNDYHKPHDERGHGTHVAGIAGAVTDNTNQVAGVCWNVPIMVVKVFGDDDDNSTVSMLAEGMVYAADNGASVMNMSWSLFFPEQIIEDAVDYAASLDIVQVASAGNFGLSNPVYPAGYDEVLGIIATDQNDTRPSWSDHGTWCDLAAPGDSILGLWLNSATRRMSGTSMAAPHVAGAAALVRELNPSLDAVDTRWVLNYSAADLGAPGFDSEFGWGRLDLFAALDRARSLSIAASTARTGESVTLDLLSPTEGGFLHVLLASTTGRAPGLPLTAFDPADLRKLPLNPDVLLFTFILQHPGSGGGLFDQFFASFDAAGRNQATFHIPRGAFFTGQDVAFAYLTLDPADLAHVSRVSNSVALHIE